MTNTLVKKSSKALKSLSEIKNKSFSGTIFSIQLLICSFVGSISIVAVNVLIRKNPLKNTPLQFSSSSLFQQKRIFLLPKEISLLSKMIIFLYITKK